MYKIFCDGELIHAPSLDDPERLVFGAKISQQANAADKLEFTIYQNNPGAAAIHKLSSVIEVYQDNDLLFRGRPIQSKEGWEKQVTYTCEGGFAFFNDTIVRPYSFQGTVQAYLQQLVTSHNSQVPAGKQFTLRTVTVTDSNNNIVRSNTDYVTTMKEIQENLVKNLGGYIVTEYTGGVWYLDYLQNNPGATSQKITLAKNLLDFLREQNAENIATAMIPLGAKDAETEQRITIESVNGGLDYIVDATAAAQYGLIFTTEVWDDVTVPANLLAKAQAKLSDYATLIPTIQLTAVDLSVMDQSIDPIRLLDTVTVVDDQHAASGQYVVMQRTYNLSDPAADSVTFGGAMPTMSAATNKTAAEVQAMPAAVLQTASDHARAMLETATGGCIYFHYDENGVLDEIDILNTDSPDTATKIWRWNIGGWGYSDDGGATYSIAATMDGVLYADIIKTGILSSDNGLYWLNMDTGEAKLKSGNIGDWIIDTTRLYKTASITAHTFTVADMGRMIAVIDGQLDEATVLASYPYYDLDGDGHITRFDVELCIDGILGVVPNGTITGATTQLYPSKVYGSVSSIFDMSSGTGFVAGPFGVWGTGLLGKALSLTDSIGSSSGNKSYLIPEQGLQMNFTSSYTDPGGNTWYTHFTGVNISRSAITFTLNDGNNTQIMIQPRKVASW